MKTDELKYVVEPDMFPEDPREWGWGEASRYHTPYLDRDDEPIDHIDEAFRHFRERFSNDTKALEITRRYMRLLGDTRHAETFHWTGYSQGDWASVFVLAETEDHAQTLWSMLPLYWQGDVWQVTAYREIKCEHCGNVEREEVEFVNAVYKESEEEALKVGKAEIESRLNIAPESPEAVLV